MDMRGTLLVFVLIPILTNGLCFHCFFKGLEERQAPKSRQIEDVIRMNLAKKMRIQPRQVTDYAVQAEKDRINCIQGIQRGDWLACRNGKTIMVVLPYRFNRFNPVG